MQQHDTLFAVIDAAARQCEEFFSTVFIFLQRRTPRFNGCLSSIGKSMILMINLLIRGVRKLTRRARRLVPAAGTCCSAAACCPARAAIHNSTLQSRVQHSAFACSNRQCTIFGNSFSSSSSSSPDIDRHSERALLEVYIHSTHAGDVVCAIVTERY